MPGSAWPSIAEWQRRPTGAYYQASSRNEYSEFFRRISLGDHAYGFPFDDVDAQSAVKILPISVAPARLKLGVGR